MNFSINDAICHESFINDDFFSIDLALIKLERRIPLFQSEYIRPVKLNDQQKNINEKERYKFAGWGANGVHTDKTLLWYVETLHLFFVNLVLYI